jgi:hypothetical protein
MDWTQWQVKCGTVGHDIPYNSDLYKRCKRSWALFSLTSHASSLCALHVSVHFTWKLRFWMKTCSLKSATEVKQLKNSVHRATCLYFFVRRVWKLRKASHVCLSICPSVRPSLRMEQLGSHRADFHEIWHLDIFRTSVDSTQVHCCTQVHWNLKLNFLIYPKNNLYFFIICLSFLSRMRNISDKIVEKIKTHILCLVTLFSKIFPFMR